VAEAPALEEELPVRVQEALGELAAAAREGLLALKVPLGLWEGSTENATVATALLSDLVERGLDPEQGMLFVIDGSKALHKAIRDVFGKAPVQRR